MLLLAWIHLVSHVSDGGLVIQEAGLELYVVVRWTILGACNMVRAIDLRFISTINIFSIIQKGICFLPLWIDLF